MSNLPSIFKSKRFWSALIGLFFMIIVEFVPEVGSNADELQGSIMIIISLLIGGYSLQDTAAAWNGVNKYADSPSDSGQDLPDGQSTSA